MLLGLGRKDTGLPEPVDPLTKARQVFECHRGGGFPPQTLEVLVTAGREILRLPRASWSDTDNAIIRHLDSVYGARAHWVRAARSWAERVEATDGELAQISELEAVIAKRQDEYNDARGTYVELARTLERGKVRPGDMERHMVALKRAERAYIIADEELGIAKGELIRFKLRVQERYFASSRAWEPILNSDGTPLT